MFIVDAFYVLFGPGILGHDIIVMLIAQKLGRWGIERKLSMFSIYNELKSTYEKIETFTLQLYQKKT